MSDHPDPSKIKDITRQVEAAIVSGQVDAEFRSGEEERRAAIEAIIAAERIDPRKLRRPMTI